MIVASMEESIENKLRIKYHSEYIRGTNKKKMIRRSHFILFSRAYSVNERSHTIQLIASKSRSKYLPAAELSEQILSQHRVIGDKNHEHAFTPPLFDQCSTQSAHVRARLLDSSD
jgi:hypothetical protein